MWRPGSKLVHPYNPELGVGVVLQVEGRFLEVSFPQAERQMRMAAEASGLQRLVLAPGAQALLLSSEEIVEIAEAGEHTYKLRDGREVADADIWPTDVGRSPIDRLARLESDSPASFRNRVQGLRLANLREAGGLGSFLGGRIELFPHQLYTAMQAVQQDPVRWLLADEVGLGKTIEACLILSALVRTGRAERALIIAPSTLTVQWLGELYRKFHQVFVLLDQNRIQSVWSDFEEDSNPFEVHPYGVISSEMLAGNPDIVDLASCVDLDLVVIDEAHRLVQGELGSRLRPIVARARHALLLTATPLAADREGFYGLLSLLHPEAFPTLESFDAAVERGEATIPCTSAVRREELGGLPPRVAKPIDVGPVADDPRDDPRAQLIAESVQGWLARREKTLVFLRDVAQLERLKEFLETRTRTHVSVFHENISAGRRDIEVARFRETNAPLLLSSEAGSEGRNFQFCDRMIHYDLPDDPVALEQRIGRLDRIGRTKPVDIWYFRPAGQTPDVARLYERLDLFERPSAGLDASLVGVKQGIERARAGQQEIDAETLAKSIDDARAATSKREPNVFFANSFRAELADDIVARIPPDLEERTREYCTGAARSLGLTLVEKGGTALYYMELAQGGKVDSLPGVPEDARYLGTFDRREALERDEIDFFASGHPLVEGLLLELEDGNRGRAALFQSEDLPGTGLVCLYKDGASWTPVIVDLEGEPRPDWNDAVLAALDTAKRIDLRDIKESPEARERFAAGIRELYDRANTQDAPGSLIAAAFFRVPQPD